MQKCKNGDSKSDTFIALTDFAMTFNPNLTAGWIFKNKIYGGTTGLPISINLLRIGAVRSARVFHRYNKYKINSLTRDCFPLLILLPALPTNITRHTGSFHQKWQGLT
jgi:hypothetical protein